MSISKSHLLNLIQNSIEDKELTVESLESEIENLKEELGNLESMLFLREDDLEQLEFLYEKVKHSNLETLDIELQTPFRLGQEKAIIEMYGEKKGKNIINKQKGETIALFDIEEVNMSLHKQQL